MVRAEAGDGLIDSVNAYSPVATDARRIFAALDYYLDCTTTDSNSSGGGNTLLAPHVSVRTQGAEAHDVSRAPTQVT
jgi:hypothetical protein